jgi:hypothetical protein
VAEECAAHGCMQRLERVLQVGCAAHGWEQREDGIDDVAVVP